MTKPRWKDEEHPDADLLLLNLEGELAAKETATVEDHLKHCWTCRARSERMQRSICSFVEHRDGNVLPKLPVPPTAGPAFLARLHRVAADPRVLSSRSLRVSPVLRRCTRAMQGAWEQHRPRVLFAIVATALALILVILPIINPPSVSAAVLLDRATVATREFKSRQRPGTAQRVLIRKGQHMVVRALAFGQVRDTKVSSTEIQLRKIFNDAGLNWDDPLDPGFYSNWRGSLQKKREDVTTAESRYIITTENLSNGSIERASISINSYSFLPQSETFYLRGDSEPLIVEALAAVAPLDTSGAASSIQPNSASVEPLRRPSGQISAFAPLSVPTPEELELAEANARMILRQIDADIREVPDIVVTSERVIVDTTLLSPERRSVLSTVIADTPWIAAQELGRAHLYAHSLKPDGQARAETQGPYKDELAAFAGSDRLGAAYLSKVRNALDVMLTHALALNRLAKRYPRSRYVMLPPEARHMIDELASSHRAMIYGASPSLRADAGPLLLSIGSKRGIAPPTRLTPSSCVEWIESAPELENALRSLDRSLSRMFSVYEGFDAEPLDSRGLLVAALESYDSPLLEPPAVCQISIDR